MSLLLVMAAIAVQSASPPASPPVPPPPPVRPDPLDERPRVTVMPDLTLLYPPASLRNEEQGQTRLRCTLNEAGLLTDCVVQASSGFPRLDEAAFRVAAEMRFTPPTRGGVPAAVLVIVPVEWRIVD